MNICYNICCSETHPHARLEIHSLNAIKRKVSIRICEKDERFVAIGKDGSYFGAKALSNASVLGLKKT